MIKCIAERSVSSLNSDINDHTLDVPAHFQPGQYLFNLTSGNAFYHHKGEVSEALGEHSPIVGSGRCLGGGSSVNGMLAMYTRASACDYDDWEKLGNPGWGSKDLIPQRPILVSPDGHATNVGRDFIETGAEWDKLRTAGYDSNDFKTVNQYSRWRMYIGQKTDRRSDTAHLSTFTRDESKNIRIMADHFVILVLFGGGRVVGVEYTSSDKYIAGQTQIVRASHRELVLKNISLQSMYNDRLICSALARITKDSHHLLDREVYYNADDWERISPPRTQTVSMKSLVRMKMRLRVRLLINHFRAPAQVALAHLLQWTKDGSELLAHNSIDAAIKLRPTGSKGLDEIGPFFISFWKECFADAPDKLIMIIAAAAA
ncbi:hypothetical protein GYMLUDRAFT_61741 [Collybiopsis luxurians FD-317 M1]|uniref:Glucose-methanol-choline oxidoreductase N-terminal domain-containing protein n=1 Tax=Collybiopsis luxurians FD-317 M1 TaxID=944289 RepID=A0A0D0BP99_9AGAR|nr:hypothetical protein GYMLUDRAFT_61741 [Collybiopsis luxurians FD-317 M1]